MLICGSLVGLAPWPACSLSSLGWGVDAGLKLGISIVK
jgi:hypothetical protein